MKHSLAAVAIVGASIAVLELSGDELNRPGFVVHASAQDARAPEPAQMRPEIDNEAVLVLRIRLAPQEKTECTT